MDMFFPLSVRVIRAPFPNMTKPASIFSPAAASFFIFDRSLANSKFEMSEKINAERARAAKSAISGYRDHAKHSKCWYKRASKTIKRESSLHSSVCGCVLRWRPNCCGVHFALGWFHGIDCSCGGDLTLD